MDRHFYFKILTALFIIVLFSFSSFAESREDLCGDKGLIVKNLTMLNLWYKKNNGDCTIWIRDHFFEIKPGDAVEIFSDLSCNTNYCKDNPTYDTYKFFDMNEDCRVRILPNCSLSDM